MVRCLILFVLMSTTLDAVTLSQHQHHRVELGGIPAHVGVVNPNTATAHIVGNALDLYALKPGMTSVFAEDKDGKELARLDVRVLPDLGALTLDLKKMAPSLNVTSMESGVRLSGTVQNPQIAQDVIEIAKAYVGQDNTVINHIQISSPCQVNLRVRVVEVSRSLEKEFGVKWKSLFNAGNFLTGISTQFASNAQEGGTVRFGFVTHDQDANIFIDALAAEGLITVLAEPDLTCISGGTASFLAGGEFPVPMVTTGDNVDVTFREFGVKLSFAPLVLEDRQISLQVKPEVSEISEANSVVVKGLRIPGLKTRKAETTIKVKSGQSMAISGLYQQETSTGRSSFPYLSDLPIIGRFLTSSRFKRRESELVIIVTPYLVEPVSQPHLLKTPLDGFIPASDFSRQLKEKLWTVSTKNIDLNKIGFYP